MGFKCEVTGKHIQSPPLRVIVETRKKIYEPRFINKGGKIICIDRGGEGWEIAKEVQVDPELTAVEVYNKVGKRIDKDTKPKRQDRRKNPEPIPAKY